MVDQPQVATPPTPSLPAQDFWAVIPAGGAGTRLWPLSREASPKFLGDLTGNGQSLLNDAMQRLAPLCGPNVLIVAGDAHADHVRRSIADLPALICSLSRVDATRCLPSG